MQSGLREYDNSTYILLLFKKKEKIQMIQFYFAIYFGFLFWTLTTLSLVKDSESQDGSVRVSLSTTKAKTVQR